MREHNQLYIWRWLVAHICPVVGCRSRLQSGNGREFGPDGMSEYLETKVVRGG